MADAKTERSGEFAGARTLPFLYHFFTISLPNFVVLRTRTSALRENFTFSLPFPYQNRIRVVFHARPHLPVVDVITLGYRGRIGGSRLIVGIPVMRETLARVFRHTAWPTNPLRIHAKAGGIALNTREKIVCAKRLTPRRVARGSVPARWLRNQDESNSPA
jgi:hypothetical protein